MNTKAMLSIVATTTMIGFAPLAGFAHGKPEHGGAFTEVREYTFELVSKEQETAAEEKAEKGPHGEKPHKEKMEFTVYVKDPSLKAVTSGSGVLKISQGSKQVVSAPLSISGEAFKANATLPSEGRYRVAIDFTPSGKKPLKANVNIKVD